MRNFHFLLSLRLYFEAVFSLRGYVRLSASVSCMAQLSCIPGWHGRSLRAGSDRPWPASSTWHLKLRLSGMASIPL